MTLYLVATPIGNLGDMTHRAVELLRGVQLIAAEDTRHSKKLLQHYDISTPMTSYHSHSSDSKLRSLLEKLEEGQDIALISDAGTPGISDPAWSLVQAARQADINIVPIPGASAFLTALMASGLPMNQFTYMGFIPAKKGRKTLFESIQDATHTTIFYESPHRIAKTLGQMLEILGEKRCAVLARELTKVHEEFIRGSLMDIATHCQEHPPKGELVLLVAPANFEW